MKRIIILAAFIAGFTTAQAQEQLSRQETLKYACIVSANLAEMLKTPIPTDPDVKRPVALHDGDYGGMVLPETKLRAEVFAKAGKEAAPVGQLWLLKLVPLSDGQPVPASKLRMVEVKSEDARATVPCCALRVRKSADGELELLVYGKDKEPVLRAPMRAVSRQQEDPIEMTAERKDDGGHITMRFLGKYEATFIVTDPEQVPEEFRHRRPSTRGYSTQSRAGSGLITKRKVPPRSISACRIQRRSSGVSFNNTFRTYGWLGA